MKPISRTFLPCLVALALAGPACADVIYSGYLGTPIPTDFTGVSLTIDGGAVNPFFGGVGVANDSVFQPVRTGTGNLDPLANIAVGGVVGSGSTFSSGFGGSQTHLGLTYTDGTEGIMGFKSGAGDYGWMRVTFTSNTSGAVIRDWAYDNTTGQAINAARITQDAAVSNTQLVTLSPGASESFRLGSAIVNTGAGGINVNRVVKTGAGTTTLVAANTYTGSTTISGGTLALASSGSISNTSGVALAGGGTFDVTAKSGGYTLTNLTGSGSVTGTLAVSTQLGIGTAGVGTIGFQNLSLGALSTATFEVTGGGSPADLANVSGTLGIDSGAVLDLVALGTIVQGDKYTLFAYTSGNLTGTFKSTGGLVLNDGDTFTDEGQLWLLDYDSLTPGNNGGSGDRYVTVTAVPEPTGAALCLVAMSLGMLRRRR